MSHEGRPRLLDDADRRTVRVVAGMTPTSPPGAAVRCWIAKTLQLCARLDALPDRKRQPNLFLGAVRYFARWSRDRSSWRGLSRNRRDRVPGTAALDPDQRGRQVAGTSSAQHWPACPSRSPRSRSVPPPVCACCRIATATAIWVKRAKQHHLRPLPTHRCWNVSCAAIRRPTPASCASPTAWASTPIHWPQTTRTTSAGCERWWPDEPSEQRLARALGLAAADPPPIVQGTIPADLDRLLEFSAQAAARC